MGQSNYPEKSFWIVKIGGFLFLAALALFLLYKQTATDFIDKLFSFEESVEN